MVRVRFKVAKTREVFVMSGPDTFAGIFDLRQAARLCTGEPNDGLSPGGFLALAAI